MNRSTAFGGLLLIALVQTGCCCMSCGPDNGCGRSYWGAYCEDPPRCEPCDGCGNWTGPCCGRGRGGRAAGMFPWQRGGRLLGSIFCCKHDSCSTGCCDTACDAPCETSCEAPCGPSCEPACGEPGGGCTSCGGGKEALMEAALTPPWPSTTARNVSYRRPTSMAVSGGAQTKPCNCNH